MLNTAQKIAIAKLMYRLVMAGRRVMGFSEDVEITRHGLRWRLDLREGIDLSIYLLGGFEPATLKLYTKLVQPGDVVLDIGANIGSHSLPLARLVGDEGRVLAFEPTKFAVQKLERNISLNPWLADRVTVYQQMLVADTDADVPDALFSSWPLVVKEGLHEKHKGQLMGTAGATSITLDHALEEASIQRVNFIKLDVDGYEYSVLSGAERVLRECTPTILMELAPYLLEDCPEEFEEMIGIFARLKYKIFDANSGSELKLDVDALRTFIPDGGSRNVVMRRS